MFRDRIDGGEQLAALLRREDVTADVALAVPRGGLPAGRAVADALDVSLDVVVARKMGAPDNPELAIGAVAADDTAWRNDDLIARLGLDESYVERERERTAEAAREKRDRYRGDQPPLDLAGKTVLVADDGAATGATTIACVRSASETGADRVVLAVPVASQSAIDELRAEADAVFVVEVPEPFGAVGRYYANFEQVSDEEALTYLE